MSSNDAGKSDSDSELWVAHLVGDMTARIKEYLQFAVSDPSDRPLGIYYFGLIACSAYFESALEDVAVSWCRTKSFEKDAIYVRILKKIQSDVSRATGLEGWKTWLRVLFDLDLPTVLGDDWKELDVLFKLRNQLAHGRTTKFLHFYRSDGRFVGLSTEGSSYEFPFDHLVKKNVISIRPGEVPTCDSILTIDVLRYFVGVIDSAFAKLQSVPVLSGLKSYTERSEHQPITDPLQGHPFDLVSRRPKRDEEG